MYSDLIWESKVQMYFTSGKAIFLNLRNIMKAKEEKEVSQN